MDEKLKRKMSAHAEAMQPMSPHPMLVGEDRWIPGLSKREYAAIQMMAGLLACGDIGMEQAAILAVRNADALFLELDRR